MAVDRTGLYGILAECGAGQTDLPAIMSELEIFFRHAEAGAYGLAKGCEVAVQEVKCAIAESTGREVEAVSFVSRRRFRHLIAADEAAVWNRLRNDRGDGLGDCLRQEHRTVIQETLNAAPRNGLPRLPGRPTVSLQQRLWEALQRALFDDLDAVIAGIVVGAPKDLTDGLADGVKNAIFFFAGYSAAAERAAAERLGVLVGLIGCAIPICSKRREHKHWLMLAD